MRSSCLPLLYHTATCIAYVSLFAYSFLYVEVPQDENEVIEEEVGGRCKYISCINVVLFQFMFFFLCILNDLWGCCFAREGKRTCFQVIVDVLFTTIVLPYGIAVCLLFWIVYMVDKKHIYYVIKDTWESTMLNSLYHALPLLTIFLEMKITRHQFPRGLWKYIPGVAFSVGYTIWVFYMGYVLEAWMYPILETINLFMKITFFAVFTGFVVLFTWWGEKMNALTWGSVTCCELRLGTVEGPPSELPSPPSPSPPSPSPSSPSPPSPSCSENKKTRRFRRKKSQID